MLTLATASWYHHRCAAGDGARGPRSRKSGLCAKGWNPVMKVPLVDLQAQHAELAPRLEQAVLDVLRSGRYVLGPVVERFERQFAAWCGRRFCVGVNSGTSALHLALRALGIGPGDEVITVSMSFVATAWAISYTGARPVLVDIDPVRRTLDPAALLEAITPRTRAIVPVHLYGQGADMEAICQIAQAYRLPVIEDAAQAHGAEIQGRRAGRWGHLACFSFYPGKNLGACGEAGAVVTDHPQLARRLRQLRDHAQASRHDHRTLGYNYRMDALQAAVLEVKLQRLEQWNRRRSRWARLYDRLLRPFAQVQRPAWFPESPSAWHLYVVQVPHRDLVYRYLRGRGIEAGLHYPRPIHLQRAYAHLGLGPGSLPMTERLAATCLSLPLHPYLNEEQVQYVCRELKTALDLLQRGGPEALEPHLPEERPAAPEPSPEEQPEQPFPFQAEYDDEEELWLDRHLGTEEFPPAAASSRWAGLAAHAAGESQAEAETGFRLWESSRPQAEPQQAAWLRRRFAATEADPAEPLSPVEPARAERSAEPDSPTP